MILEIKFYSGTVYRWEPGVWESWDVTGDALTIYRDGIPVGAYHWSDVERILVQKDVKERERI